MRAPTVDDSPPDRKPELSPTALRHCLKAAGYSPLPLNGKAPSSIKGWQNKLDVTPAEIDLWEKLYPHDRNTGILTKFCPAIDIDILHPEAAGAVEQLARERFEEHGFFMVRIGKAPKRAALLRTDEPFGKVAASLIAPDGSEQKIEVLGDGQQVVVYGIHPDTGKPYSWHGGEPGKIKREDLPYVREQDIRAFLDDAAKLLVEQFGFKQVGGGQKKPNGHDTEGEHDHADWAELISRIQGGSSLHDSLRDLAASFAASAMPEREAVRVLQALMLAASIPHDERWKARFDEIPRIVRSAREKYGKGKGEHARALPKEIGMGSDDLCATVFAPPNYVVPGYIVEGLTLFAGKPKVGKSWLMLHAALAVARGGFTLGEVKCPEGDVLYCGLEDNKRRLQKRLKKLLAGQPAPKRLRVLSAGEMPILSNGGLDLIHAWIRQVEAARLVVVDVLAKVRDPRKKDQGLYDADYAAMAGLKALADEFGIAIVVVTHLRKMDADDPLDQISGTTGLAGSADTVLVLHRTSTGTTLCGRGRDVEDIEKAIQFNKDCCTWTVLGEAGEIMRSAERAAILAVLIDAKEPMSAADIADLTGMSQANARRMLTRMAKDGEVHRIIRGRYVHPGRPDLLPPDNVIDINQHKNTREEEEK